MALYCMFALAWRKVKLNHRKGSAQTLGVVLHFKVTLHTAQPLLIIFGQVLVIAHRLSIDNLAQRYMILILRRGFADGFQMVGAASLDISTHQASMTTY